MNASHGGVESRFLLRATAPLLHRSHQRRRVMHSSMIIHRGNPIMQRYLLTRSATRFGRLACGALLTIGIADCSKDTLLAVKTPDQITPAAVASAAGAQAQRVAGIGLFTRFFAADAGGGGVSINVTTAILGHEAFTARSGTEHL